MEKSLGILEPVTEVRSLKPMLVLEVLEEILGGRILGMSIWEKDEYVRQVGSLTYPSQ